MKYWLLEIHGDVEPDEWQGPFNTFDELLEKARKEYTDKNGWFWTTSQVKPPQVEPFIGRQLGIH